MQRCRSCVLKSATKCMAAAMQGLQSTLSSFAQGSGSVDRTEASAETALQQLMAEEDEAAAKAAAKRAKKLKQKLKKQQGQQSLSHSEEGSSSPDTASKPEGSPSHGGSHSSGVIVGTALSHDHDVLSRGGFLGSGIHTYSLQSSC